MYGGGSSSYVSKASSERRTSKGWSSDCGRVSHHLCAIVSALQRPQGGSRRASGGCSYLGDLIPLSVRRGGVCGHESAEGRARGGSDEALAERRGNAPPDGPGKHGGAGGRYLAGWWQGEREVEEVFDFGSIVKRVLGARGFHLARTHPNTSDPDQATRQPYTALPLRNHNVAASYY